MRKIFKRVTLFAATAAALLLPLFAARADIGVETTVTADGSSPLGTAIAEEFAAQQAEQEGGSYVTGVEAVSSSGTVLLSLNAQEAGTVTVRLYNDYGDSANKFLLASSQPVAVEALQESVTVSLSGVTVPQYYVLEADYVSASGITNTYCYYDQTEDIQFVLNATAEDFREGYYVPIQSGAPEQSEKSLLGEGEASETGDTEESTGSCEGYIAYNEDLILLPGDTEVTLIDADGKETAVFEEMPEALLSLSEEELSEVKGFVLRGETIEDDVFLLGDGLFVKDGKLTMAVREPEAISDFYAAVKLTSSSNGETEYTVDVNTDYAKGTFTLMQPPVSAGVSTGKVYVSAWLKMNFSGYFDLKLAKTFSDDSYTYEKDPPSSGIRSLKLNVPSIDIHVPGSRVTTSVTLEVAANNPVRIAGEYGMSATLAMYLGTKLGCKVEDLRYTGVVFTEFQPENPNVNTYAYFRRVGDLTAHYGVIKRYVSSFFSGKDKYFGPIVKASELVSFKGAISGIWEKDIDQTGADVIHECTMPGKKGCVSGKQRGNATVELKILLNIWVKKAEWTPIVKPLPPETLYFFRSLEHGDNLTSPHPVSCQHKLLKYVVQTFENKSEPLANAVLTGNFNRELSTDRTNDIGIATPVYFSLDKRWAEVFAVDREGKYINQASVLLNENSSALDRVILLSRNTTVIERIDIQGQFPINVGDIVYSHTGTHYYAKVVFYKGEKTLDKINLSEVWGPIGIVDLKEYACQVSAGLVNVTFEANIINNSFISFDPNLMVTIMGSSGGNPATEAGHRFIITDVTVSNNKDNDSGMVFPNTKLKVKAVFYIPDADNQFSLVTVNDGLKACREHFYRVGTEAIAIGRNTQQLEAEAAGKVQKLNSESWSNEDKAALCDEIYNNSGSSTPFNHWKVEEGNLSFPLSFTPLIADNGKVTFNTVTFPVGKENITLTAEYDYDKVTPPEIDVATLIVSPPVPGEYLTAEKYTTVDIEVSPDSCTASGINGEPIRKVNLEWEAGNSKKEGKIQYNTTYYFHARIIPGENCRFKYPLGTDEGTLVCVAPYSEGPSEDAQLYFQEGAYVHVIHSFTTRKAKLLKVYAPDDLYFPVGTQQEVINRVLGKLNVGVSAEEEDITSAEVKWDEVFNQDIPGAGGSFIVKGIVEKPDVLDCDDESILNTQVVIHIYGTDKLTPPQADPNPGIYRRDLSVKLYQKDSDDDIYYYVTNGTAAQETEFKPYTTEPVQLSRSLDKIVTWQIHAKAVRGTLESETVTFTYILLPANGSYLLTVVGGEGVSNFGCGSIICLPYAAEVMLMPAEGDEYLFDYWEVVDRPDYFAWTGGTNEKSPNAMFNMPTQDLVIKAHYTAAEEDDRLVTKVELYVVPPNIGDTELAPSDTLTQFTIKKNTGNLSAGSGTSTIEQCGPLTWSEDVSEENPVVYGVDYICWEDYEIESLTGKTSTGEKILDSDFFSPSVSVTVNEKNADEIYVSSDLKRLLVVKYYNFDVSTYTLRYDANGGSLGDVPEQIVQMTDIPTKLTDKKPIHPEGGAFLGWSTDPYAAEPEYVYSETDTPEFSQDTTLYAVWPYNVEVRWLDNDNSDNTRAPFTFNFGKTVEKTVDPAKATEKNGVGVQKVMLAVRPDISESPLTVNGVQNGLITLSNGSVYEVSTETGEGRAIITLTAKRVYSVKKNWEIDFEQKDKPKSITVILQTDQKPAEEESILSKLVKYVLSGDGEDYEKVVLALEKETGYSLRNLSPEEAGGKLSHLVATGKFTAANIKDELLGLLKADTDDSEGWYAAEKLQLSDANDWAASFEAVDRFIGTVTPEADGTISAKWTAAPKYRVVEKAGKAPVENGKDAVFTVAPYRNITGKQVDEHKTVYQVSYETLGDVTIITNLAVEDHYLIKKWALLGEAEKPENVYIALLWRYDAGYLDAVKELIPGAGKLASLWYPEMFPISGDKISVGDILNSLGLPSMLSKLVKLPIAIAKVNEGNNWRACFRVKKYGEFGIPQEREGAEFFGAICQNVMKFFLNEDIPVGVNPLKGFITISVPEFVMPLTTDYIDLIVNIKAKYSSEEGHSLGGAKLWVDEGDAEHARPDSITIHIYEDGTKHIKDLTVKRSDNVEFDGMGVWVWSYEDEAIDTSKHTYTVTEDPVPGYTAKISGLNITNTHRPESLDYVNVRVAKVWNDGSGDLREPVTLTITENGSVFKRVTVSKDTNWECVLTKCPKVGSDGRAIQYGVREESVPTGYTESYRCYYEAESNTWNCFVTNTEKQEKILLEGYKYWDDDGNGRPDSAVINLYADGEKVDSFTLNKANNWHWSGIYEKHNAIGERITYTVKEESPAKGYYPRISGLNITNSRIEETVDVTLRKMWVRTDARENWQPVTVYLCQNGAVCSSAITLEEANNWAETLVELPKYDADGNAYVYSVMEESVPEGFVATYKTEKSGRAVTCTVTNYTASIAADIVNILIKKVWNDGAVISHEPIELTLTRNGVELSTVTLSEENDWTVLKEDMMKTDMAGNLYVYSITEKSIPAGYSVSYDCSLDSDTRVWTLIAENKGKSQEIETVVLRGTKTWVDNNDAAGARPEFVTVRLWGDGKQVAVYTLSALNNWSWSGEFVKKNASGKAITYTVTEDRVPGYKTKISGLNVTNTYEMLPEPGMIFVRVIKEWVGTDEEYPAVPVMLHLSRSESTFSEIFTLSEEENWTADFLDFPEEGGTFFIEELTELPGFYVTYDYTALAGGSIVIIRVTNIHPDDTEQIIGGTKTWEDNDDALQKRPGAVLYYVLANDNEVVDMKLLSEQNGWKWSGLYPKTDLLGKIKYSVLEAPVTNYTETYSEDGLSVTNTLGDVAAYTVEVRWLDNDNSENTRAPFKFAFGTTIEKTVDPAEATEKNGVGIQEVRLAEKPNLSTSTLTVEGVESGLITLSNGSVYEVTTETGEEKAIITLLAKRVLEVEKKWEIDFEQNDKPESITVILQTDQKPEEEEGILSKLIQYVMSGDGEDFENVLIALEKETGYSLRNLSPEEAGGKLTHLIATGQFTEANIKDELLGMLKADTDDSEGWYAIEKLQLSAGNNWTAAFKTVDRFIGEITKAKDGTLSAEWKATPKYRVVEKSGKAPVENGKDAVFTVPTYTNIVGEQIDEHKTVYQVTYETEGDKTTITNLAVEDHILIKEWVLLGEATKPENVYIALLWRYDEDYLETVKGLIPDIGDLTSLWWPEMFPLSGDKISVGDILKSAGIPFPLVDAIKLPIAIAKVNEGNNWRASFRVKKYGEYGIPQEREGAEFFGAVCQDVMKYFLKVNIPIGVNPLQGFITVSVPEFVMPLTTDYIDLIVNIKAKYPYDEGHSLGGAKLWVDEGDAEGVRPDSITIHIYEDGTKHITDLTVKRSDNSTLDGMGVWVWSYEDEAIDTTMHTYTVTEDAVPGYTTEITGLNITNTHRTEEKDYVKVRVAKVWDDDSGDSQQPLTLTITENGSVFKRVTVSKETDWEFLLTKCPKVGSDGRVIQYGVLEESVPTGYTESYYCYYSPLTSTWNCYVTNKKPSGGKVFLEGNKYWDDTGTGRPACVVIHLYADGEEVDSFTLSKANNWHWSGQYDKYNAAGERIIYTVKEDSVSGYYPKISGLDITNSTATETVDVKIVKVWKGTDETYPEQPVTVTLCQNGQAYGRAVTLTASCNWTVTYKKLPKYDADGNEYTYSAVENPVPEGFAVSYKTEKSGNVITCTVTNTADPIAEKTVSLVALKIWDDVAPVKHAAIKLVVTRNGTEYKTITLNEENGWSVLLEDLPKADSKGKAYTYAVKESAVPTGYSVTYTSSYNEIARTWTCIAENKVKSEPIILRGTKTWVDNNNLAGARPDTVTIRLWGDGKQVAVYTLSEKNNWSWSGEFVKTNASGKAIVYTVTEDTVPGYTPTISGLNVTNTYKTDPDTLIVRVIKKWVGTNEEFPAVPVMVHLKRTISTFSEIFTLSEENDWTVEITDYPAEGGSFYAEELTELPGFYVTYDYSASAGGRVITLTITNTHVEDTDRVIGGTKTWEDNDNDLKKRPDSVHYFVLANGNEVVDEKILTERTGWKWSGLYPKNNASGEITYSVQELPVPDNYTETYSADKLSVTNTLKDVAAYIVEVRWLDNDNSDKTRASFKFTFGPTIEKTVDPTGATEKNGVGIQEVRLAEKPDLETSKLLVEGVESGLITLVNGSLYDVTTEIGEERAIITLLAKRVFEVEKKWEIDFEQNDKPESLTVILQTDQKPEKEEGVLSKLVDYVQSGDGEDFESVVTALEKQTGYSLRNLSPEDAAGKISHLIVTGELTEDNVKGELLDMLKADTDDSEGWYATQKLKLSNTNMWEDKFEPVDRFISEITKAADGTISAKWKASPKYRVVEKAGKAPVEDGKDAIFTVPAYKNIAGKQIDEHKTIYQVTYKTSGDKTTITNLAVEDHILLKEWILLGGATKPEDVYLVLLWQYDSDYLEAAKKLVPSLGNLTSMWLPEVNPISGDKVSVGDILKSAKIYIPFTESMKLPIAIAKVNEGNKWKANFRIKKYGEFGIPQTHEAAEFFSAICQDIMQFFLKVKIPIGVNPMKGFISVSVPEFRFPFTLDLIDMVVNAKIKIPDDEDHSLSGAKVWDDDGDSDKVRPDSITIHIIEDGTKTVADLTLKRSDYPILDGIGVWTWFYEDDSIDTTKHTYTVTEDTVPQYTTKISGLTITNTHRPEYKDYVKVRVVKVWDDNSGDSQKPLVLTVTQNGSVYKRVTLSKANGWEYTLTKCPKVGSDGRAIQYGVREESVPAGYSESYYCYYSPATSTWNCYVTNKKTGGKVYLEGNKYWDDGGTGRPDSVIVYVYADGVKVDTFKLTEANNWHWSGQYDRYNSAGERITYTVKEDSASSSGYYPKISGLNITNSTTKETVDVKIVKVWKGTDATHPEQPVTVYLCRNGKVISAGVTLTASCNWTATYRKLTKYDADGNEYVYTAVENPVPEGFSVSYKTEKLGNLITCTVTNTAKPTADKFVSLRARKVWDDAVSVSHSAIKLIVMRNGTEFKKITLSAANGWSVLLEGLPRADSNGKAYTYSVKESTVPTGYTASYSSFYNEVTREWTCTATNKAKPQVIVLRGTKTWVDNNDADGVRPASVTVRLWGDGEQVAVYTLSALNNWSWSGTFLKNNASGKAIVYTVTEDRVPEYTTTISGLNVTNYHKSVDPGSIIVRVIKKWEGTDVYFPAVPVRVQLTRSDGSFSETFTLSEENNWRTEFTDIPEEGGTFSVKELTELYGFYVSYGYYTSAGGRIITLTITNTHVGDNEKVIGGTKTWVDNNDYLKKRQSYVFYYVLANDKDVVDEKILNDSTEWEWSGLYPKTDASGNAIEYSVVEIPVPNYEETYSMDKLSVTNTLVGSDLTVTNTVVYGDTAHIFLFDVQLTEKDGTPFSGTLSAKRNGRPTVVGFTEGHARIPLTHGEEVVIHGIPDEWEYVVTEHANEGYISWVVDAENQVGEKNTNAGTREDRDIYPSYTQVVKKDLHDSVANFYNEQLLDIPVTKVWVDQDASNRPASITINLLANGKIVQSETVTPTPTGEWSCEFKGVYALAQGKKITYTITEDPVQDYKTKISGFTVTNTYSPVRYSFTFYKVWNDRKSSHETPQFILYYSDGTVCRDVDEPPRKSSSNPNKFTYSNLTVKDDYYVLEVPMEGYRTTYKNAKRSDVTDKALNGGKVINTPPNVPPTGDNSHPVFLAVLALVSLSGIVLFLKKRYIL